MKPLEFVRRWIDRHLAHEEALLLLVLLTGGLLLVMWLGGTLAPALTALVFAFILQGVVARLRSWGLGAQPAVWAAYGLFVTIVVLLLFFVLPLIGRQLYGFVEALPAILDQVQVFARGLPERYPTLLTQAQIDMGLEGAREEIVAAGQLVVEWLFSRLGSLVSLIIYLVLVPILVFFFLKDKARLLGWAQSFLPSERPMLDQVGAEMNLQIANYVRGKALEILIVGSAAFATFWAFDLNYAALLAVLVGFSVLIPFVGPPSQPSPSPWSPLGSLAGAWTLAGCFWPTASSRRWTGMCSCRCCSRKRWISTPWPSSLPCWPSAASGASGGSSSPFPWRA